MSNTTIINIPNPITISINSFSHYSLNFVDFVRVKEVIGYGYVERLKSLNEFWPYPFCAKFSLNCPSRSNARLFEGKYFLHGNGVAFHSTNLLETDNFSTTVNHTVKMNNNIKGRTYIFPDKVRRDA